MKWRFWKKDNKEDDTTVLKVTTSTGGMGLEIYVQAQTSEKALKLYKKLKKEG